MAVGEAKLNDVGSHPPPPPPMAGVLVLPGARLAYEVTGEGPAVVLVHGFGLDAGPVPAAAPATGRRVLGDPDE